MSKETHLLLNIHSDCCAQLSELTGLFGPGADFSGMVANHTGLVLDDIPHVTMLTVDERGVEASGDVDLLEDRSWLGPRLESAATIQEVTVDRSVLHYISKKILLQLSGSSDWGSREKGNQN